MRLAAVQDSPPLRSLASNAPSTARSRSASSKTISGALPPSSIEVRITRSAHSPISTRPTSVEPVNESLRALTVGDQRLDERARAVRGEHVEHARRQAASCRMRANSNVVNGVCFAGLTTIVQPAASAGAILRVAIASGKFQGVMSRHGPIGMATGEHATGALGVVGVASADPRPTPLRTSAGTPRRRPPRPATRRAACPSRA